MAVLISRDSPATMFAPDRRVRCARIFAATAVIVRWLLTNTLNVAMITSDPSKVTMTSSTSEKPSGPGRYLAGVFNSLDSEP